MQCTHTILSFSYERETNYESSFRIESSTLILLVIAPSLVVTPLIRCTPPTNAIFFSPFKIFSCCMFLPFSHSHSWIQRQRAFCQISPPLNYSWSLRLFLCVWLKSTLVPSVFATLSTSILPLRYQMREMQ